MPACRNFHTAARPTRRELLRAGGLSLFGMSCSDLLAGRSLASAAELRVDRFGQAKACILLFMWGGPAHQETWDLKPAAPAEIRGEFQPISTQVPGIQIGEHFPLLAERTGKLAIVRSLTHSNVDHTRATHYLLTGQTPPPEEGFEKDWPALGAVLARLGRGHSELPPFVSLRPKPHVENDVPRFVEESHGQFAGWLGAGWNPLTIDADPNHQPYQVGDFALPTELSAGRLHDRRALLADLNRQRQRLENQPALEVLGGHYQRAFDLLSNAAAGRAFDLTEEPAAVRERYGLNPHGQSVLQARRLVERGVPLVTVFWPSEGIKNVSVYWDTHSRNFIDLRERLMPVTDRAFSALLDDLAERNLLDETLVVWTGEFGRTPRIGQRNSDAGAGSDGRDHWPGCFSAVLAGGGIQGGQVYGASDRYAAYPAASPVAPVDLVATVYHLLGVPREAALPDPSGRPLVICDGTPLWPLV